MGVMVCLQFIQKNTCSFLQKLYSRCYELVDRYEILISQTTMDRLSFSFIYHRQDVSRSFAPQYVFNKRKKKGETAYHCVCSHPLFYQVRFALVLFFCLFLFILCSCVMIFACFSSFCVLCPAQPVSLDCIFQIIPSGVLLRLTKIVKLPFLNRIISPLLLTECLYYTQMLFYNFKKGRSKQ